MRHEIVYSVVIPVYNEAATLDELWRRLENELRRLEGGYEVIFIDDGSRDRSFEILQEFSQKHPEIKIIRLSRNFGHQCALTAGIDHAGGKAVIMMDADLQDSPAVIPEFVAKWREGYQVVYAIRTKRKEFVLKRIAFKAFYRLLDIMAPMKIPRDAGIFSLLDKAVVQALQEMPERSRYLSGLRSYAGFRQTGIEVERERRFQGAPKVTPGKLFKLAFDGIFSFSVLPLRMAVIFGFVCSLTSFLIGVVGLYYKYMLQRQFLWPFGLTTTFFMGGIQLIFLGIIGEYIGRIYEEVKQRPLYFIKDKVGFVSGSGSSPAEESGRSR